VCRLADIRGINRVQSQALRQAARNEAQRKRRALRQAGSATQEVKRLLCEDW